uniref:valine--tRNA ligase n=1 Tax=Ditylenchus dipsaci TaxID=166011 RepID=A0A915EFP7_9BILA
METSTVKILGNTKTGDKKDVSLPLPTIYSPTFVEAAWYEWWEKEGFFRPEYGRDLRNFTVVMPPPNVTGSLHVGHALATTVEDVMCRWHRMKGKTVLYNPGCDHAGIATQVVVEKKYCVRRDYLGMIWDETNSLRRCGSGRTRSSIPFMTKSKSWEQVLIGTATFFRWIRRSFALSNRLVNWSCTLRSAISDIEVNKKEFTKGTFLKVPGYEGNVKFGVLVSSLIVWKTRKRNWL